MIQTQHIGDMLKAASALADGVRRDLDVARAWALQAHDTVPALPSALDRVSNAIDKLTDARRTLERVDNLAEHASAELRDELLRAREGWPVV